MQALCDPYTLKLRLTLPRYKSGQGLLQNHYCNYALGSERFKRTSLSVPRFSESLLAAK
jgi:hypothetical protein